MPRCTPAMAAGAGLFDSGPVVARDSPSRAFLRSGVLCPVRGNLGEASYVGTDDWEGSLMEPFGASRDEAREGNRLREMVGTRRLELLTSTVSFV
jgi:hypothetical protein